ncbi:MAG: MerR family transcriptional regulator [Bacteroidota bacterium]
MRMEKRKFRIGELADHLGVERFVIRFWEKEFSLKAKRSNGGQRFYGDKDIKKFELIKDLLYNKKFTIAGAKKLLKDKSTASEEKIDTKLTHLMPAHMIRNPQDYEEFEELIERISTLQKHLLKLRELL